MFKLDVYIKDQKEWSKKIFGEGKRIVGITEHIKKELDEIVNDPDDPFEWLDVVILALDGAWRNGLSEDDIIKRLREKQLINFSRKWGPIPKEDEVSEHIENFKEENNGNTTGAKKPRTTTGHGG